MLGQQQRQREAGKTGRQLMNRSHDDRMRLHLLPLLKNRSERPGGHAQLQDQEAGEDIPAEAVAEDVWRDQQRRSAQTHQHSKNGRPVQAFAARQQRFESHQPKR